MMPEKAFLAILVAAAATIPSLARSQRLDTTPKLQLGTPAIPQATVRWRVRLLTKGDTHIDRADVIARAEAQYAARGIKGEQRAALLEAQSRYVEAAAKDSLDESEVTVTWKGQDVYAEQTYLTGMGQRLPHAYTLRTYFADGDRIIISDLYDRKTLKPAVRRTEVKPRVNSWAQLGAFNTEADLVAFCGRSMEILLGEGALPSAAKLAGSRVLARKPRHDDGVFHPGAKVTLDPSERPVRIDVNGATGRAFVSYRLTWEGDEPLPVRVVKSSPLPDGGVINEETWERTDFRTEGPEIEAMGSVLKDGQGIDDARFGEGNAIAYRLRGNRLPTDDRVLKRIREERAAEAEARRQGQASPPYLLIAGRLGLLGAATYAAHRAFRRREP